MKRRGNCKGQNNIQTFIFKSMSIILYRQYFHNISTSTILCDLWLLINSIELVQKPKFPFLIKYFNFRKFKPKHLLEWNSRILNNNLLQKINSYQSLGLWILNWNAFIFLLQLLIHYLLYLLYHLELWLLSLLQLNCFCLLSKKKKKMKELCLLSVNSFLSSISFTILLQNRD